MLYGFNVETRKWIARLVAEGRRVGKSPWACDGGVESVSAGILRTKHGICEQETMKETCARRLEEKREEVTT